MWRIFKIPAPVVYRMYTLFNNPPGVIMRTTITPSLEFMKLQNDSFLEDLATAVAHIRLDKDLTTRTINDSNIEAIIFKRLKMTIEFSIQKSPIINAHIVLPNIDKNHIFAKTLAGMGNNSAGKIISNIGNVEDRIGFVDINKVRVGGAFSKIPLSMVLTSGLFNDKISDKEIAVTILHELGHAFTYFYYLLHTTLVNFISTAVASDVMGARGDDERIIIIEKGFRILGIDGVAVRDMVTQTSEQITTSIQTLYINDTVNNLRSETGFGMYELRAVEQLADWFASKFGGALYMARLQEKLYTQGIELEKQNIAKNRLSFKTALIHGALVIVTKIPISPLFTSVFLDETVSLYDNDVDRIKFLRRSIIDDIRTGNIPEAEVKNTLESIGEIADIENRISDDSKGFLKSIATMVRKKVLPNYRRNLKAVDLQKNLEDAMYNDSYVYAMKLKEKSK